MTILTLAVVATTGCSRTLFPEGTARTPYQRYLALRGRDRPAIEYTPLGGEKPNLRQRLAPLDQP